MTFMVFLCENPQEELLAIENLSLGARAVDCLVGACLALTPASPYLPLQGMWKGPHHSLKQPSACPGPGRPVRHGQESIPTWN